MMLARDLGQPNPDAMLAAMPARVFADWVQFYQDDPPSETRADRRAAIVAWTVHAVMGGKKNLDVDAFHAVKRERRPRRGHGMAAFNQMIKAMSNGKSKKPDG